jgi:hypothetical protein
MWTENADSFERPTDQWIPGAWGQRMIVILASGAGANHSADKGQQFFRSDMCRMLLSLFGAHAFILSMLTRKL